MNNLSREQTIPDRKSRCVLPPLGWRCTRDPGHEGPCAAVPETPQPSATLGEYLAKCLDRNVIDHAIRAQRNWNGSISFYIHPLGANGDTPSFHVHGNELTRAYWNGCGNCE